MHHVRSGALGGDLTCIAWNHAADDPFMFATGSHDGTVRIWTKPPSDSPGPNITDIPRSSSPYDVERTTGSSFNNTPRSESPNVLEQPGSPLIVESPPPGRGDDSVEDATSPEQIGPPRDRVVTFVDGQF